MPREKMHTVVLCVPARLQDKVRLATACIQISHCLLGADFGQKCVFAYLPFKKPLSNLWNFWIVYSGAWKALWAQFWEPLAGFLDNKLTQKSAIQATLTRRTPSRVHFELNSGAELKLEEFYPVTWAHFGSKLSQSRIQSVQNGAQGSPRATKSQQKYLFRLALPSE